MKKIVLSFAILALSFTSCKKEESQKEETPVAIESITSEETEIETVPDSATVAKAWMDYATPSKAHKMLANDTGTWDAEMLFWEKGNPEPQKLQSKAVYSMILDEKYQEGTFTGEMWGMPFEGRAITAYDNASEEFIATWIDNMGTGLAVSRGHYDEATKTLNFEGTMVDPVTKKEKKFKEVITYIDKDNQKMEMFDINADGTTFKTMEINSKRKK